MEGGPLSSKALGIGRLASDREVHKVTAYVTCEGQLLVFSQPAASEAGIQVPSGTVEDGEQPHDAVVRETNEETGLEGLRVERLLGTHTRHVTLPSGELLPIHRHFFHLSWRGPIQAQRWRHWELNPSFGPKGPIEFELYWVPLARNVPKLEADLGDLLHEILPDA